MLGSNEVHGKPGISGSLRGDRTDACDDLSVTRLARGLRRSEIVDEAAHGARTGKRNDVATRDAVREKGITCQDGFVRRNDRYGPAGRAEAIRKHVARFLSAVQQDAVALA